MSEEFVQDRIYFNKLSRIFHVLIGAMDAFSFSPDSQYATPVNAELKSKLYDLPLFSLWISQFAH